MRIAKGQYPRRPPRSPPPPPPESSRLEVVVRRERERPGPRRPGIQSPVPVRDRGLEIALLSAHPVRLPEQRQRRALELPAASLGGQLDGPRRARDGLLGLLRPQRRVPPRQEALDLVHAVELGDQLGQLPGRAG